MATHTINRPDRFPTGSTVAVYLASNWPVTKQPPTGDPQGSSITSATATATGVTFTGLASATAYYAHTDVSGDDRYVGFTTATAQEGAGIELGFAAITASFVAAASAAEDVPGLSITVTEGTRPYYLKAETYALSNNTAARNSFIVITDAANTVLGTGGIYTVTAATGSAVHCAARVVPTAPGTVKTYKVRTTATAGSIPTVAAAPTGPATLCAVEA